MRERESEREREKVREREREREREERGRGREREREGERVLSPSKALNINCDESTKTYRKKILDLLQAEN